MFTNAKEEAAYRRIDNRTAEFREHLNRAIASNKDADWDVAERSLKRVRAAWKACRKIQEQND